MKGIVASSAAFCVWTEGGEVYTWGHDDFGGNVKQNQYYSAKVFKNVEKVFATKAAFAAKRYDGKLFVWGSCFYGGCLPDKKQIMLSDIAYVIATSYAFLAFSTQHHHQMIGWGHPMFGGKEASQFGEKIRQNGDRVQFVAATVGGAIAVLTQQGRVYTWGMAMGGGDSQSVTSALQANVTALYHTDYAFAATNTVGDIIVWGGVKAGGSFAYKKTAAAEPASSSQIMKNVSVISLASTCSAFAGLTANHSLVMWGNPYEGGRLPVRAMANKTTEIKDIVGNEIAFFATMKPIGSDSNNSNSNSIGLEYLMWGNTKVVLGNI